MKEYIEREKAIELVKNYGKGAISDGIKTLDPVDDIVAIVKGFDLIPAADVTEVVRCDDCVNRYTYACPVSNTSAEHWFEETNFCSYGERKEDKNA